MQKKTYSIIGYSSDSGGGIEGTGEGPSILRNRGLREFMERLGVKSNDLGDCSSLKDLDSNQSSHTIIRSPEEEGVKNLEEVYSACRCLYQKTTYALEQGSTPLILGGDHSLSVGSVAAVSDFYRRQGKEIGLIWIDAHADINTPATSPSQRIYGMSVAILLGLVPGALSSLQQSPPSVKKENLAFIGQRDLDPGEQKLIKDGGYNAFTMKEVDIYGMAEIARRSIEIASADTAGFIVSFDLDVCDPALVPGTQTPKRGGLTFREAHLLVELLYDSGKILGFEIVELNPRLDRDYLTAEIALSLVESALGKSII